MKLNIACPQTGNVKTVEVDDEKKLISFYEKRIGAEVPIDAIGPEWTGYVCKVTGGNDKQGFPMMQGVLVNHRVRLLFKKGMPCFRERRRGSAKRKSVRGCIIGSDLSALNMIVAKKGENEIPGLTDEVRPVRLGPKRATRIRKLFGLSKEDDVRKFVVRRQVTERKSKAPKIQRLVTDRRLARKAAYKKSQKDSREATKAARAQFQEALAEYTRVKKDLPEGSTAYGQSA